MQYSRHEFCFSTRNASTGSFNPDEPGQARAPRLRVAAAASFNLHYDRTKSPERPLMMDLVYVLAIIGFFALCVTYTYAFDRI